MYKLSEEKINFFLSEPEFGMGYQLAQVELNGKSRDMIIFNAELMLEISELPELSMHSVEANPEEIVRSSDKISKFELIRFYEPTDDTFLSKVTLMNTHVFQKLVIKKLASSGDEFRRFSAYKNDKRVNSGRLLPGSYATTSNDACLVPSGLAAVGRFALPSPFPAIYVFNITLNKNHHIEYGTARPKFNQAGGGVEVLFKKASYCTVVHGSPLPIG